MKKRRMIVQGRKPGLKQSILLLVMVLSFFLSVCISAFEIQDLFAFVDEQAEEIYGRQTETLVDRIDAAFASVAHYTELFRKDSAIKAIAQSYISQTSVINAFDREYEFDKASRQYIGNNKHVRDLLILTEDWSFSLNNSVYYDLSISVFQAAIGTQDLRQLPDRMTYILTDQPITFSHYLSVPTSTMLMAAPLLPDGSAICVVLLNADFFRNLNIDENVCRITLDGKDIYGREMPASKQYRVYEKALDQPGMTLYHYEKLDLLYNSISMLVPLLFVSLAICVLFVWLLSKRLFDRLLTPLSALKHHVEDYGSKRSVDHKSKETMHIKTSSIRTRFVVFLAVSILIPVSIYLSISYGIFYNGIRDVFVRGFTSMMQTNVENVDLWLQEQKEMLQTFAYNFPTDIKQQKDRELLTAYYRQICELWNSNAELITQLDHTDCFASSAWIDSSKITESAPESPGLTVFRPVELFAGAVYIPISYYIPGNRHINSQKASEKFILLADANKLKSLYEEISFLVYNSKGDVISGDAVDSALYDKPTSGSDIYYIWRDNPAIRIYQHIDVKLLQQRINQVFFGKVYLFLMLYVITVIIAYVIFRRMMRPLKQISASLAADDLLEITNLYEGSSRISEIDELGRRFNDMKQRIDTLMDDLMIEKLQSYQMKIEWRDAEIHSLQLQIQPHFLCNLLEMVCIMNNHGRYNEANDVLRNMGNLFRYSLPRENPIVSVEEDLSYTHAFVDIIRIQKPGIVFDWNVDPQIMQRKILRLLIQPLIENAVVHGMRNMKNGTIRITIQGQNTGISTIVEDNGNGIDPARFHLGIGLSNVQKRIEMYYGGDGQFMISGSPGKGTTVKLFLPEINRQEQIGKSDPV